MSERCRVSIMGKEGSLVKQLKSKKRNKKTCKAKKRLKLILLIK